MPVPPTEEPFQLSSEAAKRDAGGDDVADSWRGNTINLKGSASRDNVGSQSDGVICILLREEGAHREQVVDDGDAATDDRGSFAGEVPSDADTRRKVGGVLFVERPNVFADLLETHIGFKVSQLVVGVAGNALQLVAKAEVEGDGLGDAPIVLEKSREKILRHVADRITRQNGGVVRIASQKAFQRCRTVKRAVGPEADASPGSAIGALIDFVDANSAPNFKACFPRKFETWSTKS